MQKLSLDRNSRSSRKPWSWTGRNEARADDILTVTSELRTWWPVTARQVYYRLISSNRINQKHWLWNGKPVDAYSAIGRTLKWMRIDERLPWGAIIDDHRVLTAKRGFTDTYSFINAQSYFFLTGYSKCLAQKQPYHIEIWIEKAALQHIVKPVADEFCRRVVVCRGYDSVTFQAGFYDRATDAMSMGQTPLVLYFGDWDPSGVNMIYAAMQTLQDELGLVGVEYYRAGINPEHFPKIAADPVPIKKTDTRSKKFIQQHGTTAYELDALHPLKLQELVRDSIQEFTDMNAVAENKRQEKSESKVLDQLKEDTLDYMEYRADELGII